MQRPSLLEGDDFSSIGDRTSLGRRPADRAKAAKLSIAGLLFVAAGVLFCAQLGMLDRPAPVSDVSDDVHQGRLDQTQRDAEELKRLEKAGQIRVDGA